ncbi:MAG: biopolymer transporter ExbD, partial [Planctomycetota bacterium]|nr:biopolymer transporter ExbD [Planctomycetota bacterium]
MRLIQDRANPKESRLEMTSMIDVTFLLLIFFMCTLRFKDLEGLLAAHLPKDVGLSRADAERAEPVEIVLRVVEAGSTLRPDRSGPAIDGGRFVYGDDRVVQYRVGPWSTTDLAELEQRIREVRVARAPTPDGEPVRATIDPRTGTIHDDVMQVMDRVAAAGFERVALV